MAESFKIGQLRKADILSSACYTEINENQLSFVSVQSQNPFDPAGTFSDFAIKNIGDTPLFRKGKVYYFRFKIQRVPQYYYSGNDVRYAVTSNVIDKLDYSLTLRNYVGMEYNEQLITNFSVPIQERDGDVYPNAPSYFLFETCFSPRVDSTHLVFKLNRVAYDAFEKSTGRQRSWLLGTPTQSVVTRTDSAGNEVHIKVFSNPRLIIGGQNEKQAILSELNNIIPSGHNYWKKFGFQTRPGALIAVNKEPIRVGRSGIFEINNGIKITNFMIAPSADYIENEGRIDHFLLDYIAAIEE